MVCGALARAARQQGQRRLLAWRQALAEVQSAPEQQRQQQQQHGYWAPAGLGGSTCSTAAWSAVGSGLLASAAAAGAPGWQQQLGPQQLQQRRGMALNFVNFRPRRRDAPGLPNRRLPDRNEQIRAPEVRVLFPDESKPAEVMPTRQAIKLARAEGLDVVMVGAKADPPVVRMVEWSKVLYELQKKEKTAVKQKLAAVKASAPKEVRIGCQIAEHDLGVKMAQARRFLEEGHMLRLVVTFKGGPQIALGRDVTLYLIGQLADLAKVRDEKQLQRPMRGHWAVQLQPLPPAVDTPAKAPPHKKPAQQQQQQQKQEEQAPQAPSQPQVPPPPPAAAAAGAAG